MFTKRKIWKLQRPLASNENELLVMAYTEDKTELSMIPMTQEQVEYIFRNELKVYVWGRISKDGAFDIKKYAEEQDW